MADSLPRRYWEARLALSRAAEHMEATRLRVRGEIARKWLGGFQDGHRPDAFDVALLEIAVLDDSEHQAAMAAYETADATAIELEIERAETAPRGTDSMTAMNEKLLMMLLAMKAKEGD